MSWGGGKEALPCWARSRQGDAILFSRKSCVGALHRVSAGAGVESASLWCKKSGAGATWLVQGIWNLTGAGADVEVLPDPHRSRCGRASLWCKSCERATCLMRVLLWRSFLVGAVSRLGVLLNRADAGMKVVPVWCSKRCAGSIWLMHEELWRCYLNFERCYVVGAWRAVRGLPRDDVRGTIWLGCMKSCEWAA
jgi:hypothetical protein